MNSVLHHKLKVETRQTVMENLGRFDESRLRAVSCQAHSFYIWVCEKIIKYVECNTRISVFYVSYNFLSCHILSRE